MWCSYVTTKQFFLSHQWLLFSQLHGTFSSCLSYFSALFNTADYHILLETLFCYLKWPQIFLLSCLPLWAFLLSCFAHYLLSRLSAILSIPIALNIIFVWSVPKYVGNTSHISLCRCWSLSKECTFPQLTLIFQVSVWLCLFQRILSDFLL